MERHRRMRAAVIRGDGEICIEERPLPAVGPGELLIKTEVCGVGLDDERRAGSRSRAGYVMGREATGRVAQIGSGVDAFEEGDRVFVISRVPCQRCRECRRGRMSLCVQARLPVIEPGGFAEYFRVSAETVPYGVWRLPASLSFEIGTLVEPIADVVRGAALASIRPGDIVAVVGLGFVGMAYLQVLKRSPASRLIGLDYSAWRRRRARQAGAHVVIDPRLEPARDIVFATNDGRGADVVVVATPYRTDWDLAFDLCAKGGHLHLAVPPRDDWRWSVPPGRLFADELRVTAGGPAAPTEIQAVLDLLTGARFDANDLITHRFGLAEIEAAFELEQAADASLKAVVFPASNHLASTEVLYDAVI